jgi:hypothetical protein
LYLSGDGIGYSMLLQVPVVISTVTVMPRARPTWRHPACRAQSNPATL